MNKRRIRQIQNKPQNTGILLNRKVSVRQGRLTAQLLLATRNSQLESYVPIKILLPVTAILWTTVVFWGCEPNDKGDAQNWGQDTLSSDGRFMGTAEEMQGFDFSEGRIRYEVPVIGGGVLDMAVEPLISGGQAVGANLTAPSQLSTFYEMGNTYLENITEAPPDGYLPSAPVVDGYSYCVLTTEGTYAKIYIVDSAYGEREGGVPYAWIRFDWVYQKDGGRVF